ncbi:hypothetical protein MCOR17_002594 [Pyricularia oryzae]|nr:hypothetical protein MCOR17_002594 [Pyricularia oryzae]
MADLSSEPERNHAAAEDDDDHDNDGILHDAGTVKTDNANAADRIVEILEEEQEEARHAEPPTPIGNGVAAQRYHKLMLDSRNDTASDDGSIDGGLPRRAGSPIDSLLSVPDDSPSAQGSVISSPSSSSLLRSIPSRPGLGSPTPSFRPFDRRFQSRIASPSLLSQRPSSPAFLSAHSRNASLSSTFIVDSSNAGETETSSPPWEVVRWTKLKKLTSQAFSETGKRNFGSPTCIAVSDCIVLGTSKGIILMFDFHQNLKMIIGPGTKAVESGAITSIAVSADHTTIAGGHVDGSIFTWDTARSARPFLHIPHLDPSQLKNRTADGHVPNVAITHLGFLGTRRTALVSADDRGMAFAHLATRGTGALGRVVKTSRILGRYPGSQPPPGKPLKPSTVLAFAPLPLGNIERATDTMGLTAMLTPYLLVVVSTTPVAQTQHKSPRPKEVAPHSTMSGCLAWFPAVKLKVPDPKTGSHMSKVKLVYCWSNVLTVLEVDEIPADAKDKPPSLGFKARSRWRSEEAIVAVQWLTRSVLTVLTVTQRLIVLEDQTMRMTEAFDLIHKHIYHTDLFSKQLYNLVEQHDEEDTTMHGVVADSFSMSFRTYKGRIFLLGFNDVSIGALSNWADRLIALMEHGDYITAIQLATSYYTGDADKLTIGLPEDAKLRHDMVQEKLMEIISASLKYAFGQRKKDKKTADDEHMRELAETCFVACHNVGDVDFLFDEMYEWYEDAALEGIFLETLEPYVLDKSITQIPPTVVKAVVAHFVEKGWESRLEEMVCHMDTMTLDLDQMTSLCRQHSLYDALIYVWNQALNDFLTPLIELLKLLLPLMLNGEYCPPDEVDDDGPLNALKIFPYLSYVLTGRVYPTEEAMDEPVAVQAKSDIYWFLFSGKSISWPKGSRKRFVTRPDLEDEPSFPYLRMILKFNAPDFLACLNEAFEDGFLNTDAPEKLLNGRNGNENSSADEERVFGATVDRQYIISILTETMTAANGFGAEDTVYLDMFIARNMAKYPQYLLLPGSTLTRVLRGLCDYPGPDLADDAQLSVEYLLSMYQPPDLAVTLMPLFRKAGFYRVLKRIYKGDHQYGKLIATYFEDRGDRQGVFECIAECLAQAGRGRTKRQLQDVHAVVRENARALVQLDPARAARTIDDGARELHADLLEAVDDEPQLQFRYLRTILEPSSESGKDDADVRRKVDDDSNSNSTKVAIHSELVERYVRLMCRFDPMHVSEYIGLVQSTADLRLESLLPAMEETGVVDAAVVLMARDGRVGEAMQRLVRHLGTLESALLGLLAAAYGADGHRQKSKDDEEELMEAMKKYILVGIWLCQGQTRTAAVAARKKANIVSGKDAKGKDKHGRGDGELSDEEKLWLDLINATVRLTRSVSAAVEDSHNKVANGGDAHGGNNSKDLQNEDMGKAKILEGLRSLVQQTFTALLTSTSTPTNQKLATATNQLAVSPAAVTATGSKSSATSPGCKTALHINNNNFSFLRILRAFLAQAAASSPSLADLRAVLATIFSAYAYEESILRLANRLLERSLFVSVGRAVQLRQRGWRPRGSTCEACGRRVTGPGVAGSTVLKAWEEKENRDRASKEDKAARRRHLLLLRGQPISGGDSLLLASDTEDIGPETGKGKGKATEQHLAQQQQAGRSRADFKIRNDEPYSQAAEEDSALAKAVAGVMAAERRGPSAAYNSADEGSGGGATRRKDEPLGPLVVLACRHIYHQSCLEVLQDRSNGGGYGGGLRYKCPIDR